MNLCDASKWNFANWASLLWAGPNCRNTLKLQLCRAFLAMMFLLICLSAVPATESNSVVYVFGRSAFPASNSGVAAAVGDFNGDGRPDFVSLNSFRNSITVLLAQPNGGFVETPTITFSDSEPVVIAVVAGDFNGDGKLDLALARPSTVTVLLGNGNGTFGNPMSFPVKGFPESLIAEDFNRDGHLDLAVTVAASNTSTGNPGVVAVLLGNGDGTFGKEIDSPAGIGVRGLVAGDFNGDQKLDLAVVNAPSFSSNTVSLLLGNGDGTFSAPQNLTVAGEPTSVQVADFNKDGNLDLAVATLTTVPSATGGDGLISILLGNGNGTFQPRVDVHAGGEIDNIVIADLNHDGNPDIVADSHLAFNGSASVLLGNGDGTFQAHQEYQYGGILGRLFAVDFNGDGNVDIGVANGRNTLLVLLGDGQGHLAGSNSIPTRGVLSTAVISGDINNDGLPELIAVNTTSPSCPAPGSSVSVFFPNGDGTFHLQALYATGNSPAGAALGDFAGHGHLDLAVVNTCDSTVSVLLNNGDGSFGPRTDYSTGNGPAAVVAGDFNHDGITDLAIANAGDNTVSILLGNGDGTFKQKVDHATGPAPVSIFAADLTGDGNLDLVTADAATALTLTDTGKVSVLLGVGDGGFQSHNEISIGQVLTPNDVVVGDFNHDGKPDLAVVANRNAIGGVVILAGNGDGTFLPLAPFFSTGRLSANATVADFDNDGIPDIAVTSFGQNTVTLLKGNGDGTFSQKGTYGSPGQPIGIVAGDFNHDNLPDIAFVNPFTNALSTYLSTPRANPDFTLLATPPTATVSSVKPVTVSYTVTVSARTKSQQTVALGCSGAPLNSICTVSPSSVTVSASTPQTVTVSVIPAPGPSRRIPPGIYTLAISGISGSGMLQHNVSVNYAVKR